MRDFAEIALAFIQLEVTISDSHPTKAPILDMVAYPNAGLKSAKAIFSGIKKSDLVLFFEGGIIENPTKWRCGDGVEVGLDVFLGGMGDLGGKIGVVEEFLELSGEIGVILGRGGGHKPKLGDFLEIGLTKVRRRIYLRTDISVSAEFIEGVS